MSTVTIIEAGKLDENLQAELMLPSADVQLPEALQARVPGAAVVIRRHERSTSFEDSYGFPKATYIDGYSEKGDRVTTKGLYERTSSFGKVWQSAVEQWKIGMVRFSLVGNNVLSNIFER